MPTTVIDLKDAARFFQVKTEQARKAAKRGLLSAALRSVQVIVSEIIPSRVPQPVDRGAFLAGWRAVETPDGAEIFNSAYHAPFIEEGVRGSNVKPGRAMIQALAAWAQRKGMAKDPVEARSMAFAMSKTMQRLGIFNRGSKGLGILRELNERRLNTIVREEVEREMGKVWNE